MSDLVPGGSFLKDPPFPYGHGFLLRFPNASGTISFVIKPNLRVIADRFSSKKIYQPLNDPMIL